LLSLRSEKDWPTCDTRGVDTQLNALDAVRDLLQAQLDLRQIKLNELLSVVQLYKALGGGWQS
jgi:multidrug efflux system outer membrane protein